MALTATVADAEPSGDGWATTSAAIIEWILTQRSAQIDETQRKDHENRRTRNACGAGQRIVALMEIGEAD